MNSFGHIFRITILGESHGPCVGIVIDGCPAGLSVPIHGFYDDLRRRMGGIEGTTPRKEEDIPLIKSGIFNGQTTGAPICILFDNKDVDSSSYESMKDTPRPGHADFTAWRKHDGFNDYRGGGHFSGRLTAGLVAAGVIAKLLIKPVSVEAELIEAGGSQDIKTAVQSAMQSRDSIGGIVMCRTRNLPVGLGEPFFDSVESLISHMAFAIPAVKGIEFGAGFSCAQMRGSECNDEIININGETRTNNAGGINGGITNGNDIFFKVAVRPTSSISMMQHTINLKSSELVELVVAGRHDACIALRVPVIVEAVTAIALVDLMLIQQTIKRTISASSGIMNSEKIQSMYAEMVHGALSGCLDAETIFSPDSLAELDRVTARLEYLKHIIREKDQEELEIFSL
jgi:chorismate synthase